MEVQNPKVLFILGWGRSGSTVLANVLGEVEGCFSAGELTAFWSDGLKTGTPCGCGRALADCEIWSKVLAQVEISGRSIDEVAEVRDRVTRERNSLRVLAANPTNVKWPDLAQYLPTIESLYHAVAEVTESRLVIDSSKNPTDAAVLRLLEGVDPYFLHLVRDPRATAFSWQRKKVQRRDSGHAEMPRRGPANSTARWLARNLGSEALRLRCGASKYLLVRYEDFVAAPLETAASIMNFAGEPTKSLSMINGKTLHFSENHTVSGNPGRFTSGLVELKSDDEWISSQRASAQWVSKVIAAPLLFRYGYAWKVGRVSR